MAPPKWMRPQLSWLAAKAPSGPAMDPRDQARRLPHGGADRRWRSSTADAIRSRLDRQISFDRQPLSMFNDHETSDGEAFCRAARKHGLEGPCRSAPIGRGAWIKTKCLSRAESVVVGWRGPGGHGRFSARFCSAFSTMTAACSMPAGSERGCRKRRSPCSLAG
jgi:hypothetical protein